MRRKLTLSIDEQIYKDLHLLLPNRKISSFVEESIRERIKKMRREDPIEEGFKMMGKDVIREKEAELWCEMDIGEELWEGK